MKPGNQVRLCLYQGCQVRLTMIVEAEWNRRLGRGFDSRRLHHKHTGRPGTARRILGDRPFVGVRPRPDVFVMGATWVRLGAIKARLRLG